jgi:hypothetical protein
MSIEIDKLIEQVGTDTSGKWMRIDQVRDLSTLIVQECGVALTPMLRDMVSRGQAYDLIKQHFGVNDGRNSTT